MINKPKDWEETKESEVVEGEKLPVGPKLVQIKDVIDHPENEYLEIRVDIVRDAKYANWFAKQAEAFGNWPNTAIYRASYKETATRFFKAFITAIQKSNQGYVWNWDEQTLKGKLFVANFGEEEYYTDSGELKVAFKIRECRSIEAYQNGDVKVLELKKAKAKQPQVANPFAQVTNNFNNDDLPF